MSFNMVEGKRRTLLGLLENVDKRRSYTLYIATCYFKKSQLEKLIAEAQGLFYVNGIKIYLDRKAVFSEGVKSLQSFSRSINKDVETQIYVTKGSRLFHTKGYALVAHDDETSIHCASLVVGSANCTNMGLRNRGGNTESLLSTTDINEVANFIESLKSISFIDLENVMEFDDVDDVNFQYALIKSGYFHTKWSDSLNKFFKVTFRLTEEGRAQYSTQNKILIGRDFVLDAASISKQYFDFSGINLSEEGQVDLKNSIETRFGRWIPKKTVASFFTDYEAFSEFKVDLKKHIEMQKERAISNLVDDYHALLEAGFISEIEGLTIDCNQIIKKVDRLLHGEESESILEKIYYKLVQFELPYDLKESEKIQELFQEMWDVCSAKQRKSETQRLFLRAIEDVSLEALTE